MAGPWSIPGNILRSRRTGRGSGADHPLRPSACSATNSAARQRRNPGPDGRDHPSGLAAKRGCDTSRRSSFRPRDGRRSSGSRPGNALAPDVAMLINAGCRRGNQAPDVAHNHETQVRVLLPQPVRLPDAPQRGASGDPGTQGVRRRRGETSRDGGAGKLPRREPRAGSNHMTALGGRSP